MVATRLRKTFLCFLFLSLLLTACGTPTSLSVQVPAVSPTSAPPTTSPASPPSPTSAPPTTAPANLPTVTALATQPPTTAATASPPAATGSAPTAPIVSNATTVVPAATGSAPTAPATTGKAMLAYIDESSLKIMNADGQEQKTLLDGIAKLGAEGRPDWSPDNSRIAFSAATERNGAAGVYVIDLKGQNKKLLASQPAGTRDIDPRWSYDGQFIAFTRIIDSNNNKTFDELDNHEIWVSESGGQNARKITDGRQPAWAPNNLRLVFVTNGTVSDGRLQKNALNMVNAQGQNRWEPFNLSKIPTDLSGLGFPFGTSSERISSPTWLDNGRLLGFVVNGFSGLIVTINASNGGDVKFWDTAYDAGFGMADGASKGTTLAYQGLLASGVPTVHIQNMTGKPDLAKPPSLVMGGPRQQKFALYPAVSPDGSYIAYSKGTAGDTPDETAPEGTLIIGQYRNGQIQEKEMVKGRISGLAWSK